VPSESDVALEITSFAGVSSDVVKAVVKNSTDAADAVQALSAMAQEECDLSIWRVWADPGLEPERVRVVQTAVWLMPESVAKLKEAFPFDTYAGMDDRVVLVNSPASLSDFNLAFGDVCYLQLVGLRRCEGATFGLITCNAFKLQSAPILLGCNP